MVSIVIIEDSKVQRQALAMFLEEVKDFELVGQAADGLDGLNTVLTLKPAIVLVDIGLPTLDGIQVTRQAKQRLPNTCMIMLTAHDNNEEIFASFAAGADGYVLKQPLTDTFTSTLEMAIRAVRCGTVWLDPLIARRIIDVVTNKLGPLTSKRVETLSSPEPVLSEGEKAALHMVAKSQLASSACYVEPTLLAKLYKLYALWNVTNDH
ncbi:MAG: response regulator transcription factor [Candidatus Melainabacteria bacterium]|nr:response regulator transcription factor [Candidatus Melainabacteria bacterium]